MDINLFTSKSLHSNSMSTKGVENVGSSSEVENHCGWAWVLHSLNLINWDKLKGELFM